MAIFRTKKVSNFTVVDNILIDDKELNIEEKGLMLILLRLPENWDFSAKGLSLLTGKNKDTTNRILKSLENKHYLYRKKHFKNGKIAGNYYYVFENKKLYKQFIEKQDIEKQDIEKQDIENRYNKQILSKTNTILNKNEINKYPYTLTSVSPKNEIKKKYGKYQRIKLTDDEVKKLIEDFGKDVVKEKIEQLDEYVEINNNKNKYKNFNLVIRKAIKEKWFDKIHSNKEYKSEFMKGIEKYASDNFEPNLNIIPEFRKEDYE